MRWVARRFTPVCRSRCGARGADRNPGAGTTPHPPIPPPSLLSVLRTGVWVRVRGVNSLAKHPERVGTGPKDKKRLQIQLTWQNWRSSCFPVPPLPGAREGRGSLELVEIFQMSIVPGRFTPVCRSRCGTRGRSAAPASGGSYGGWDHSPCVRFCLCRPTETTLPLGVWDQQRRVLSECECECGLVRECGCACYCECARRCEARRCEARRCEVRAMGPRRLCVVLLLQANRNDTSYRAMGLAAESTH